MNERIIKLGLDSHMLNYIDNETPRRYFLSGHADEDDLQKFAELIVKECARVIDRGDGEMSSQAETIWCNVCRDDILKHFGVER